MLTITILPSTGFKVYSLIGNNLSALANYNVLACRVIRLQNNVSGSIYLSIQMLWLHHKRLAPKLVLKLAAKQLLSLRRCKSLCHSGRSMRALHQLPTLHQLPILLILPVHKKLNCLPLMHQKAYLVYLQAKISVSLKLLVSKRPVTLHKVLLNKPLSNCRCCFSIVMQQIHQYCRYCIYLRRCNRLNSKAK